MALAKTQRRFATVAQIDVPQGRNGKHKGIVSAILAELDSLADGEALKIELTELGDSKENVRSALNRASHKLNQPLATAADAKFLYVWSSPAEKATEKKALPQVPRTIKLDSPRV
jgi:hypothetical protein